ncbi:adenosylcobinamide-GDP ribazoletransferase [Marinobacterium weihaiense]|uniref:Adenosylcobinamide-GDP ribazoletransferase n=1 Tax=Marinobacterium weihaiense TaxID=2851016 RepID=A0ABS6MAP9_9GAMM|nr:adenosylcobinamide-GDP ribazoletransferase [Marinobacterium weihaiense]MBV0933363.1 adenosylcobinamide-GDP ribazoletransferase [Marinobacterium weihaiense]
MRTHWLAFLGALQFLTLIPVRLPGMLDAPTQQRTLLYYPLVGLLLGLVLLVPVLLTPGLAVAVQAALVLVLWCALTGGLHLDGLADSADGWMGGLGDRERTLAIMKDPHVGASGALALMLQLLLKWSLLQALLALDAFWPLLLAPVAGRCAAQYLLLLTPYARPGGLASGVASPPALPVHLTAATLALLLAWQQPLLPLVLAAGGWALRWLMLRRLQGYTGDTAGALIELIESLFLLAALMVVM